MKEVRAMKIKAIDYILKVIENHSAEQGFDIDNYEPYLKVCEIVTNFDFNGKEPTYDEKVFCGETIQNLMDMLKLNYMAFLNEALKKIEKTC